MKNTILAILLLNSPVAFGQEGSERQLFQSQSKSRLHYVELNNSEASVYIMGGYYDKGGSGYSISATDTLVKNADGDYSGRRTKIIADDNKFYLLSGDKKNRKFLLEAVKDKTVVNRNLNNAYYLDHYFKMSDELNKMYPSSHSFRNGFYSWKEFPEKDLDYIQFRHLADKRIKAIKDSISRKEEAYTVLTKYITENINSIEYDQLRDSLARLYTEQDYYTGYCRKVIDVVAKQRPEWFFRLAEDYPSRKSLMFFGVEDKKETITGLKAVEGHESSKKEFFKERRENKSFPYKIAAMYIAIIGGIALLIAAN